MGRPVTYWAAAVAALQGLSADLVPGWVSAPRWMHGRVPCVMRAPHGHDGCAGRAMASRVPSGRVEGERGGGYLPGVSLAGLVSPRAYFFRASGSQATETCSLVTPRQLREAMSGGVWGMDESGIWNADPPHPGNAWIRSLVVCWIHRVALEARGRTSRWQGELGCHFHRAGGSWEASRR